ncbi:MAG TPA: translation initiation factor [Anaeromyxobacteraceae bacterium]|nr:translation initiation factor [Anaeromyxobacteraceae bacterium]
MSRRKTPAPAPPAAPFNAAFARLRERLPAGALPDAPPPSGDDPQRPPAAPPPARAVVRLERKGRGGKEATVIERLDLPPDGLASWLLELKRSLGCGGGVEGDALVLQGDQRERAAAWLEDRGVRRVTRG